MKRAECVSESADSEVSTKECSLFIQAVLILTSLKYLGWSGDIAAAAETTLGVCVAQPSSRCYPRLLQTASFLRTSLGKCTLFAAAAQVVISVTAHEGLQKQTSLLRKPCVVSHSVTGRVYNMLRTPGPVHGTPAKPGRMNSCKLFGRHGKT